MAEIMLFENLMDAALNYLEIVLEIFCLYRCMSKLQKTRLSGPKQDLLV